MGSPSASSELVGDVPTIHKTSLSRPLYKPTKTSLIKGEGLSGQATFVLAQTPVARGHLLTNKSRVTGYFSSQTRSSADRHNRSVRALLLGAQFDYICPS